MSSHELFFSCNSSWQLFPCVVFFSLSFGFYFWDVAVCLFLCCVCCCCCCFIMSFITLLSSVISQLVFHVAVSVYYKKRSLYQFQSTCRVVFHVAMYGYQNTSFHFFFVTWVCLILLYNSHLFWCNMRSYYMLFWKF